MLEKLILIGLACVGTFIAMMALQECLHLQAQIGMSPQSDLSGIQARKFFFTLIATQTFYRAVEIVFDVAVINEMRSSMDVLIIFVRCSPHMIYLSTLSVLVTFWAQTCCALDGTSFIEIRNIFLYANILLYIIIVVVFGLFSADIVNSNIIFAVFTVAFFMLLCAMITFYLKLCRLLPDSYIFVTKVFERLQPVAVFCCTALFIGFSNYFALSIFGIDWLTNLISDNFFVYDFIMIACIETIPCLVVVMLMSKNDRRIGNKTSRNGNNNNGRNTAASNRGNTSLRNSNTSSRIGRINDVNDDDDDDNDASMDLEMNTSISRENDPLLQTFGTNSNNSNRDIGPTGIPKGGKDGLGLPNSLSTSAQGRGSFMHARGVQVMDDSNNGGLTEMRTNYGSIIPSGRRQSGRV